MTEPDRWNSRESGEYPRVFTPPVTESASLLVVAVLSAAVVLAVVLLAGGAP